MSEANKDEESISVPPLSPIASNHWISMAFAKQQHDSEEVSKELEKLRLENSRLKNELERCQRTVHDNDPTKWILVNHELWIVQQEHLKNFDCNRWRYDIAIVMVAFSLFLVSGK